MEDTVIVTKHGRVAGVALNRVSAYNAFDLDMITRLAGHLNAISSDPGVEAVVLSGRGRAFCAGGDLKWASGFAAGPGAAFHALAAQLHLAVVEIRRMKKPVAAAIGGIAAGAGFSLALACDFRVMESSAVLLQAYTSHGLSIDGGGTFMLPRIAGLARSLEIAAFDEPISSAKAQQWGLATRVVEDGKSFDEAQALVCRILEKSVNSFAWSKRLMNDSFTTPLETQLEMERQGLSACAEHPDGQRGLAAFLKKRGKG
jgi:2-(1,2-epoxy-1,2-dihydrophenyl)acetyl-CoA isomerase